MFEEECKEEKEDNQEALCEMAVQNNCILPRNEDVVDYPPNDYVYRIVDVCFVLFGVGTLLADWVFDVIAAYNHWQHSDFMWFAMTVVFMSSSSLVIMFVSLYCYIKDRGKPEMPEVSNCKWKVRFVLLVLQLGPLLRYYDTLKYGLKSRKYWKRGDNIYKQKQYYTWMLYEESDCVFLRMFECFMEAAPQLILQLYILVQANDPVKYSTTWRYFISLSSVTSLVSLAWGVTAFYRSARFTDLAKNNISIVGSAFIFLWHLFCLAARVTAMVLFASVFQLALVYLCAAHCFVMAAWLMIRRTKSSNSSPLWNVALSCLMGIVYIFVFLNDKDEPTRKKYIMYYTIWEVENVLMMVMWLLYGDPTTAYYLPAVIFHFISFLLGIVSMLVYYACLHPDPSPPPLHPAVTHPKVEGNDAQLSQTEL